MCLSQLPFSLLGNELPLGNMWCLVLVGERVGLFRMSGWGGGMSMPNLGALTNLKPCPPSCLLLVILVTFDFYLPLLRLASQII